ncbi:MAG: hypothetical protein ACJ76Z_13560, partial [Thermoleophilaceae bacterium]
MWPLQSGRADIGLAQKELMDLETSHRPVTAIRRWRLLAVFAVLVATVALAGPARADAATYCAQSGTESVATDQPAYPNFGDVQIAGSGYGAGCQVIVEVVRPDGSVVTGDGSGASGSDVVATDANGDFTYAYKLSNVDGTYIVNVVGDANVVLATTTFEDALRLDELRLNSNTGPANTIFTAGNVIHPAGVIDGGKDYKVKVLVGSATSTTVAQDSGCLQSGLGVGSSSPTTPAAFPASTTFSVTSATTLGAYTYKLEQYTSVDGTCSSPSVPSGSVVKTIPFNVARATVSSDPAFGNSRTSFKAGATAYFKFSGLPAVSNWHVTWIRPSQTLGSASCLNTSSNADLPDAAANGDLPDQAGAGDHYIQYAPGTTGSIWNLLASYDTVTTAACPVFGTGNAGAWSMRVDTGSPNPPAFLDVPFSVDTTPPETTLGASKPANPTNSTSASFSFTSDDGGASFECSHDGGAFGACSGAGSDSYSSLSGNQTHSFAVRAVDSAGNADPSPAS